MVLTAAAADGVITTAVNAGGVIAAPTAGGKAGRVLVSGIGGDVEVDGQISATGSNTTGGQITVASDHHVTVAPGAVVDASGDTGGGTLALGTTAAVLPGRALVASGTTIAPTATLRARAWHSGHGGRIAIASSGHTSVQGAVTAQGGDLSGDGGSVSLAGATIDFPGAITTRALHGAIGVLAVTGPGGGNALFIGDNCVGHVCTPWDTLGLQSVNNTLTISNAGDIDFLANQGAVSNGFTSTTISLSVLTTAVAGHTSDVNIDAGVGISVPDLSIISAGSITLNTRNGHDALPPPTVLASTGNMTLTAGHDILAGQGAPGGSGGTGTVEANLLAITAGRNVQLDGAADDFFTLNGISGVGTTALSGTITLVDNARLRVTAPVLATGSIAITVTGSSDAVANDLFVQSGFPRAFQPAAVPPTIIAGDGVSLTSAGSITINAGVTAGTGALVLNAKGGDITAPAPLTAGTLAGRAAGAIDLTAATNAIASVGTAGGITGLAANAGEINLQDAVSLRLGSALTATSDVTLDVTTAGNGAPNTLTIAANVTGETLAVATSGGAQAIPGTVITLSGGATLSATGGGEIPATITLDAALGDVTLGGVLQSGNLIALTGVYAGSAILQAATGSITESSTGSILSGTLAASAGGDILLATSSSQQGATRTGNQIALLAPLGTLRRALSSGGAVSLTDGQDLTVDGLVSAASGIRLDVAGATPNSALSTLTISNAGTGATTSLTLTSAGGTIALAADHFDIESRISAPGGLVALDRAHAGNFTLADTGGTIDPASLDNIAAGTLALGSQDGVAAGNTADLLIDTGAVSGDAALDFTSVAATLGLFATGAITEQTPGLLAPGAAGLDVTALYGTAGQQISLTSTANSIARIGGPLTSTAGAITLADARSLAVDGAVTAAGNLAIALTPPPANPATVSTLSVAAAIRGANVTLTTAEAQPPASLSGPVIAVQAGSAISAIGSGGTAGTLTLAADLGNISIGAALFAGTGALADGAIMLNASGGSLLETAAGGIATGRLAAGAALGTLVSSGGSSSIFGGAITLSSGGTATVAGNGINRIGTLSSATAVTGISLTDNASLSVTGPVASSAGNVALLVDTLDGAATGNTLAIGATTIAGRSVSLVTAGSAITAPAAAITLAAGSVVSASGTQFTPTDIQGTIALSAAQGGLLLGGTLTGLADGTTPYFAGVALDAAAGGITESATGAVRATTLAAAAGGDILLGATSGTASGQPVGNQIAQTGTSVAGLSDIATLGTLVLVDGEALTVTGTVSAGPLARLVTPALTLGSHGTLSVATGGKLLLAADDYTIGGTIAAPSGVVSLGLLTGGTLSVIAGAATAPDEIGAADLSHITAATLALGSTDGVSPNGTATTATQWDASTAGSVALLQILAALDVSASVGTLALFSNGAITATGSNAITATALAAAAATGITLTAGTNRIGTLTASAHQTAGGAAFGLVSGAGDIAFDDNASLLVAGAIDAPGGAVAVAVAGAQASNPDFLHIGASRHRTVGQPVHHRFGFRLHGWRSRGAGAHPGRRRLRDRFRHSRHARHDLPFRGAGRYRSCRRA